MTATSEHFTVEETAPGVWTLLAGDTGACISNAAVIDLGDRTVVVDTFMTLAAGEDLVRVVHDLTGRSAFLAVNSHWHDDHTGGNQLLGSIPIVSTRRTVELMVEYGSTDPAEYAADIEEYLEWTKQREAEAVTDEDRRRARSARNTAEIVHADRHRFRLTLPTLFIDDRMTVRGSEREIDILTYGGGHTESDVFVSVPAERLIVGGDLIWVDRHPRTKDGDPGSWAQILDRMAGLSATRLVPGHGPVTDGAYLGELASYLQAVESTIAAASGLDEDEIVRIPVPAGSEDWLGPHNFFDGVATLSS